MALPNLPSPQLTALRYNLVISPAHISARELQVIHTRGSVPNAPDFLKSSDQLPPRPSLNAHQRSCSNTHAHARKHTHTRARVRVKLLLYFSRRRSTESQCQQISRSEEGSSPPQLPIENVSSIAFTIRLFFCGQRARVHPGSFIG